MHSNKMAILWVIVRILFVSLVCLALPAWSQVQVTPDMTSFSSAIKGGHLKGGEEKVLYARNHMSQPGVITEQWFTGVDVMDENTIIRIYIDDETSASLEFQLLLAHGVGFGEKSELAYIPWGTRRIAHAADGGIYNTYRIPFSKSFRITAQHPKGGTFWYIIRGVHNYPVVLGDLILPKTSRLRVYKNENKLLVPFEFLTLADVTGTAGALYQVTIAANSSDFNYLEACVRANIDGDQTTWLSSGTEDFFLSAYYFNKGSYHFDNAGLTYTDGKGKMSAYKFFENDPLFFTKSLTLTWRCGETINGPQGCPNDYPPPGDSNDENVTSPNLANTTVTTYTWVYEYTF